MYLIGAFKILCNTSSSKFLHKTQIKLKLCTNLFGFVFTHWVLIKFYLCRYAEWWFIFLGCIIIGHLNLLLQFEDVFCFVFFSCWRTFISFLHRSNVFRTAAVSCFADQCSDLKINKTENSYKIKNFENTETLFMNLQQPFFVL